MGLDIYFYKLTNVKQYDSYSKIRDARDKKMRMFDKKYYKEYEQYNKLYNSWYENYIKSNNTYPTDFTTAPKNDFISFKDSFEMDNLNCEVEKRQELINGSELDDLYMRKENWMVSFVQQRHPECLIYDKSYGKILKNGKAILNKNDIKNLVKRMTTIKKILSNNWEALMRNEHWQATNELKDLCDINLPTMSRFFFGSTAYDYCYFNSIINVFLPLFQNLLSNWVPGDRILYMESW